MPVGSLGRRGAIHAAEKKTCTCRANRGASSQEKRKTLFLGQKRCSSLMRPALRDP
jgi:hypothetical protein